MEQICAQGIYQFLFTETRDEVETAETELLSSCREGLDNQRGGAGQSLLPKIPKMGGFTLSFL